MLKNYLRLADEVPTFEVRFRPSLLKLHTVSEAVEELVGGEIPA